MLLLVTTCFLIFTSPQYIRYIIFANYPILKDVETFAKVALLYQCTQKSFFTNRYFYIHFSFTNLQQLPPAKVVAKVMFVFPFIPLYRVLVPLCTGPSPGIFKHCAGCSLLNQKLSLASGPVPLEVTFA